MTDGRLRLQTDRMDPNHVPYMNIKLMICFIPAALTPPVISRDVGLMAAVLWLQSEQDLERQKNPSVYHLAATSVTLKLLTNVINLRGTSANCVTGNVGKTNIRRREEFSETGKIRGKMLFNKKQ